MVESPNVLIGDFVENDGPALRKHKDRGTKKGTSTLLMPACKWDGVQDNIRKVKSYRPL